MAYHQKMLLVDRWIFILLIFVFLYFLFVFLYFLYSIYTNTRSNTIRMDSIININALDDIYGTRNSKGPRDMWFTRTDVLRFESNRLNINEFKRKYCGYTSDDVAFFFDTICDRFHKPRATYLHSRNKFLLWLDFLKNPLAPSHPDKRTIWHIGNETQYEFIREVTNAILETYHGTDIISMPGIASQETMRYSIQLHPNKYFSSILFALDGSHKRCKGRNDKILLSWKYSRLPCHRTNCFFQSTPKH
eukprot:392171_1